MSPDAVVRVRDSETGELAKPGRSGELEIRAPSRFLGYFHNPDATRAAITDDGFFRTGDIGYLREDGSFVYETRGGDAMRLGGFLVAPGEIEDELKACAAFVITDAAAPPDPEQLIAQLRNRLAGYKVPARIFFIDAFPVTESANGVKIQRGKLRAIAMERIAGETGTPRP